MVDPFANKLRTLNHDAHRAYARSSRTQGKRLLAVGLKTVK
jgi:hypothetical protein